MFLRKVTAHTPGYKWSILLALDIAVSNSADAQYICSKAKIVVLTKSGLGEHMYNVDKYVGPS